MTAGARNHGRTVVVGLGNTLQGDDGIGPRAAQRLAADPRCPARVEVIDGGTAGLALLGLLHGTRRLVILDAVDAGRRAGSLLRLSGADLRGLPGGGTAHDLGAADLLVALAFSGEMPAEVILLGLQPGRIALCTELSPPVAAALPALVEAVLAETAATPEIQAAGAPSRVAAG